MAHCWASQLPKDRNIFLIDDNPQTNFTALALGVCSMVFFFYLCEVWGCAWEPCGEVCVLGDG